MKTFFLIIVAVLLHLAVHAQDTGQKQDTVKAPKPLAPVTISYTIRDVEYHNYRNTIHYKATITIPQIRRQRTLPSIVLISSGFFRDKEEELAENKRLETFADHLTRTGYITLRITARNVGDNRSDSSLIPFDIVKDVNSSLDYLKEKKEVNKKKLGIIGYGQGGVIASIVASIRDDIDFMVLLGSPGEPITKVVSDQNKALLTSKGVSNNAINAYAPLFEQMVSVVLNKNEGDDVRDSLNYYLNTWIEATPDSIVAVTTGITDSSKKEAYVSAFIKTFDNPWSKYLLHYDPRRSLRGTNAKVFAIVGEGTPAASTSNATAIQDALKSGRSPEFEVKELAGLSQVFQNCLVCSIDEYKRTEQPLPQATFDAITGWLKTNVNATKKTITTRRR